ncbi:agamous-like MADS-box protein AGL92 [Solanum tuberosum]|nr:PREDICTED: agamous-like MADS-box protein AGL92 [Solanum tuberosum]
MSNTEHESDRELSDDSNTKNPLYKKIASLSKKAQELSILCDIPLGLIIFCPGEVILWPTETQVKERFEKYLSFPEFLRMPNLVTHESNLDKMMKAQEENITKMEQNNKEKKTELLFNEVVEGKSFYELDAEELKGLINLVALKKNKVDERKKQLHEQDEPIKGNDNNIGEKKDERLKN